MKRVLEIRRDVQPHWVGDGFPVRSLFSYSEDAEACDPFLLLDYAGPQEFPPADEVRGVGEHPHRGFETVTIVSQGELSHRDSSGSSGNIGPGDVQWMTAASGVVHEEFHSEGFTRRGGTLEMVQLWVNLPAKLKLSKPRYQEILKKEIPTVQFRAGAGLARVIAGELLGTHGPAQTYTSIQIWEIALSAGGTVTLPLRDGDTALLVVQKGAVTLNGGEPAEAVSLVLFDRAGDSIEIKASEESKVLFLGGEPLNEPVVGQGPFVMNSRDEIRQAILDFQSGRMGALA